MYKRQILYGVLFIVVESSPRRVKMATVESLSWAAAFGIGMFKVLDVYKRQVEYHADKNEELLGHLLDTDEGARHIGEVALVPASSPINRKNILFYNTLFDENAACHIAFGAGYPGTVEGGTAMTKEQLLALGVNDSLVHEDIMVGAPDMDITAATKDGRTVQIFKNGEWAF